MTRILYLIFFFSGATSLVYQVVWVRLTGLIFGNTSYSIATVLGAFMGGLALGSWVLGSYSDKSFRPLRLYGILEISIGVFAALVPFALGKMENLYWDFAPRLAEIPAAQVSTQFAIAFLIMIIPTFLMGGTLPILTRVFVRQIDEVESKLGILYALNTFGAAVGTLLTVIFLVPVLGNQTTVIWIASMNILIGLIAIRIDLVNPSVSDLTNEEVFKENQSVSHRDSRNLILLTLIVSGFVSMTYEVAWTRALTALIGSSTYAFAIMLVTFLVGIASGSAWASRFRPHANIRLLGLFQLSIAVGAVVFLIAYLMAPYLLIALLRALYYSFPAILTTQFLVCASLMILPTFFMGATFPIAGQLFSDRMEILGRRIGGVYSINSIGAIGGSLVAGFFLVPFVGTERTILIGLFLNSAMAVLLLAEGKRRYAIARWIALSLLLVATVSMTGGVFWDPNYLDRGVLIYAKQFEGRPELKIEEHYTDTDIVYWAEGKNANISVRRGNNYIGLRTNGKVDASNGRDMITQLLVAYLPGLHHPNPERALVIGYGSGVSAGVMTVFPELDYVDCLEIEPAVVEAGPWFSEVNRHSYDNPKVNLIFGDARNYLNINSKKYDLIVSEPSNPWVSGVGSLFTAEFYELAASALNHNGIFAQWLQLYELSPEELRMVFGEFQRQFPEVSIWDMGVGDIVLLGSRQSQHIDWDRADRLLDSDKTVRRDFWEYLNLEDPFGLYARYVISSDEVREFSFGAMRNTDNLPLLEFHAPRNLFSETLDLNISLLKDYKSELFPPELPDERLERAYVAIIKPLIEMGGSVLAGQAVRELALLDRKFEDSVYIAIARLNIDSSQYSAAEDALNKAEQFALDSDPYSIQRRELWAQLREKEGNYSEAIRYHKEIISSDPMHAESLRKIAELSAQVGEWNEATVWMMRYIETSPNPLAFYWALLGEYLVADKRYDDGLAALESTLEIEPYSYLARIRLAEVLEDQGDKEKAIEHLEFLVLYAQDRDVKIYTRLANLYLAEKRNQDARRILLKGARIFPKDLEVYKGLQNLTAY